MTTIITAAIVPQICQRCTSSFACNYDYFGLGLAMYYTEDTFDGIEVVDGRHMIVLNSGYLVSNADPEIIVLLDRIRN